MCSVNFQNSMKFPGKHRWRNFYEKGYRPPACNFTKKGSLLHISIKFRKKISEKLCCRSSVNVCFCNVHIYFFITFEIYLKGFLNIFSSVASLLSDTLDSRNRLVLTIDQRLMFFSIKWLLETVRFLLVFLPILT